MSMSLILGHSWLPGVQFRDAEASKITGLQPNLEVFISAGMARGDDHQADSNFERTFHERAEISHAPARNGALDLRQ